MLARRYVCSNLKFHIPPDYINQLDDKSHNQAVLINAQKYLPNQIT